MALERHPFEGIRNSQDSLPQNYVINPEDLPISDELVPGHSFVVPASKIPTDRYSRHWEYEVKRQAFQKVLKELSETNLPGKEHIEEYIRDKYLRNFQPKTLLSTFRTINLFLVFLNNTGKNHFKEITRQDMEAFIEHEQDRGLMISTVRTRLRQLNAFIDFLIEAEIVDPAVLARKIRVKVPESLPRSMDPEDVDSLLSVETKVRDRAMVLVLLRTGMRIGELLKTKVSDVNLKEQKIMIYEGEKNRLGRVVYFSADARDALKAWIRERDSEKEYLFYAQGRHTMTYVAARMRFNKYLQKAGLSNKGYTLHSLRHTYATELLNARMQVQSLQALLGHSNIEMTRRYARLADKTLEEEYFRAMSIIEKGERNGFYKLDPELQAIFEKTQLLTTHGEELPQHP